MDTVIGPTYAFDIIIRYVKKFYLKLCGLYCQDYQMDMGYFMSEKFIDLEQE